MLIREATQNDNLELQALQERCPQGTSLVVSMVNTPDFFARAKAHDSSKVYVACEDGHIIGSIACATGMGMVNGQIVPIGYQFQLFTAPERRREGVGRRLFRFGQDCMMKDGAQVLYGMAMEDNITSIRLLENEGFSLRCTQIMHCLLVHEPMEVSDEAGVRNLSRRDLPDVSRLINETWQDFDLYEPVSAETLARLVEHTPGYGLNTLFVLEREGELVACLGFWDRTEVSRITVMQVPAKMADISLIPGMANGVNSPGAGIEPGSTLRHMVLSPIGFKDPEELAVLMRHVNNEALGRRIDQILLISREEGALLRSLRGFVHIDTKMHVYVKILEEGISKGDRPVFIDGVHL
ncbi:GNAT family N-acetyltransferase [Thermodesulfobacteriota bacterium]